MAQLEMITSTLLSAIGSASICISNPDTHIGVDVNAAAGNATIVCTGEQRQRLIAMREKLLKAPQAKTMNIDPDRLP